MQLLPMSATEPMDPISALWRMFPKVSSSMSSEDEEVDGPFETTRTSRSLFVSSILSFKSNVQKRRFYYPTFNPNSILWEVKRNGPYTARLRQPQRSVPSNLKRKIENVSRILGCSKVLYHGSRRGVRNPHGQKHCSHHET